MESFERRRNSVADNIHLAREQLRNQLAQGRLQGAVDQVKEAIRDLHLQEFDLHYVAQDYPRCAQALQLVGDSPKAYERWVYLHAHAAEFRDERTLLQLVDELGRDNPHAVTAMALSAREKDSSISPEEVYKLADAILKPRDLNYASHSDAYLLLCCGKLALANQDYTRALQFLDMADRAYPKGCFYYRRVEVQLSRSEALEATGDLWGAFGAAESAMIAATNQLATDSSSSLWSGLARQAKERRAQMESLNFANIRLPEL